METLRQDLSYGFRTLFKNPGFTAVAVLSLAIGIGANSAIFSVINALLLRPLPYQDADRLAILWQRSPGLNVAQDWFSPGQCLDVKAENQVFEQVAVTIGSSFNLTGQGGPEHVDGARVTSSLFPLLGAKAALGRVLLPEEDSPGKPATVILSHGFWRRRFGGDPQVIGKTLVLSGSSFEIVGVMQPGFSLTKEVMLTVNAIERADVLLPLPMSEGARTNRGNEDFNIFAKLKPGVSLAQAQADMDVIAGRMKQRYPENYPAHGGLTISVVPLLKQVVGEIDLALYVLLATVGFVLLIACANVANLLLARATVRQKEIAIRAAVGASRARIARQLLTESALLALTGGMLGMVIALGAVEALRAFGPENIPRLNEIGVDGRVVAFTFFISMLTGIVFGLAPALRASRVDLNETLKEGGRGADRGHGRHMTRKLLVVFEVALSLIVLICAGLLIRSYRRVVNAHPGFDSRNVHAMRLSLPGARYSTPESIVGFFRQVGERLERTPGVESVGTSYSLPMSAVAFAWEPITIEGYAPPTAQDTIISNVRIINPGYFDVMRIPLKLGRYFTGQDIKGAQETVIVNEALAERFWPNEYPIGKRLQRGKSGPWKTVVGMISDTKEYSAEKEPPIAVYYPAEQVIARNMYLVIRTTSDPVPMTAAMVKEIQAVDPEMPVYDIGSMDQRLYGSLARQRFSMFLLGVFALIALILAAIGVYGVMAYSVSQLTHEIGVRIALGARPDAILRLVIRQALILAALGIAIGLVGAFALTRVMSSLLFGVSATDLLTFVITSLLLGSIALMASYIPARRAAKVDPIAALQHG
jgi:putative ABC transport system permease protein